MPARFPNWYLLDSHFHTFHSSQSINNTFISVRALSVEQRTRCMIVTKFSILEKVYRLELKMWAKRGRFEIQCAIGNNYTNYNQNK